MLAFLSVSLLAASGASVSASDAAAATQDDSAFAADLGPQGPGRNREIYGFGTTDVSGPLAAGEWGTWTFTYHVGGLGVDDGGRIWLLTNIVSDWVLQTDRPTEANYLSVRTSGRARVSARMDRRHAGSRPFWGGVVISVYEGDLAPGDTVTVVIGDRSQGGPGARAPMIVPNEVSEIRFAVDALNNSTPVRVQHSPRLTLVAAPATRLEAVWPSEAAPGSRTWLLIKAKDAGGNAATSYRGNVRIRAPRFKGLPDHFRFQEGHRGYHRFDDVRVPSAAEHVVVIEDTAEPQLTAHSNVLAVMQDGRLRPYCGDLHGQHVVGSSDAERFAEYARGFAGIDFMSWAINDFHLTTAAWQHVQEVTRAYHAPGRFVVFPGYEWSATTGRGGDHNVIHMNEGETLLRSGYVEHDLRGYDPATDRHSMAQLLPSLDPSRTFLMPHIGGRRADLGVYDPRFMSFIEIYSDHGQFEWFAREALERGLKTGFVASSDDAFGKLGDSPPGSSGLFAVHGGLTCAYAEELTREALWKAFKARRVYGTTGERMQVRLRAGEHWMGEEIQERGPVRLAVQASGTAGIERVDVYRGTEVVHRHEPVPPGGLRDVKLIWRGAASRERARQTVWNGTVELSAGRIVALTPYRLDHSGEALARTSDRALSFATLTAGDEDGVVMRMEAPADAQLTFRATTGSRNQFGATGAQTRAVEFNIALGEIAAQDTRYQAGGVDREVLIRKVGERYPRSVRFEWEDPMPRAGDSAYWVRVMQTDGATAWSSPIFVNR